MLVNLVSFIWEEFYNPNHANIFELLTKILKCAIATVKRHFKLQLFLKFCLSKNLYYNEVVAYSAQFEEYLKLLQTLF